MNKKKKLLTVVTLVILMLGASVFTVSAEIGRASCRERV